MPKGSGKNSKLWRYGRWVLLVILVLFLTQFATRFPVVEKKRASEKMIEKIHAQKLTTADADGKHLPPPPDPKLVDATVEGIDANQNGIRDDVELAIFAKYPTDLKLRAALLQYAMAEQMYLTSVFSTETWKAAAQQLDRAYQCIGQKYDNSDIQVAINTTERNAHTIETLVVNTDARSRAFDKSGLLTTTYGSGESAYCDVVL